MKKTRLAIMFWMAVLVCISAPIITVIGQGYNRVIFPVEDRKYYIPNLDAVALWAPGDDGELLFSDGNETTEANDLYYDDANGRLGIGTISPQCVLDVNGTICTANDGNSIDWYNTDLNDYNWADVTWGGDLSGTGLTPIVVSVQTLEELTVDNFNIDGSTVSMDAPFFFEADDHIVFRSAGHEVFGNADDTTYLAVNPTGDDVILYTVNGNISFGNTESLTGLVNVTWSGGGSANANAAYAHISESGASHSYINQNVTTTGTPTFDSVVCGNIYKAGGVQIGDGNYDVQICDSGTQPNIHAVDYDLLITADGGDISFGDARLATTETVTWSGGGSANANTAYTNRVDTWNYPLSFAANAASCGYNTTNLKLTANELDTIQGISTAATPQFDGLGLGTAAVASNVVTVDKEIDAVNALGFAGGVTCIRPTGASGVLGLDFQTIFKPHEPASATGATVIVGARAGSKLESEVGETENISSTFMRGFCSGIETALGAGAEGTVSMTFGYHFFAPNAVKGSGTNMGTVYAFYDAGQTKGETANWGYYGNTKSYIANPVNSEFPILHLQQDALTEPFLKFIGKGNGSTPDITRSLVDTADVTPTLVGFVKVEIDDIGTNPAIADGDYYIPVYTLAAP